MPDEEFGVVPIDDGPITEGPPKTIPELFDRLVARENERTNAQTERDVARDQELLKFKTDEQAWKEKHDREAIQRHFALFGVYEKDREANALEHKEFRTRMTSIETTGVPLDAWKLVKEATKNIVRFAAIVAIAAVVIAVGVYAELAWRVYAFDHSPVLHVSPAEKAPQVERR